MVPTLTVTVQSERGSVKSANKFLACAKLHIHVKHGCREPILNLKLSRIRLSVLTVLVLYRYMIKFCLYNTSMRISMRI